MLVGALLQVPKFNVKDAGSFPAFPSSVIVISDALNPPSCPPSNDVRPVITAPVNVSKGEV